MADNTADRLRRRQDELQIEAHAVRAEFRLDEHLARHGRVVSVGSAALGLMVWRDLDLTVVCPQLDAGRVAQTGARLAADDRMREVVFRNDTGGWNTDPAYPDGLYLGLRCRSGAGRDWRVDIWFVDEPERQPDLAHLQDLPPRLDAATRDVILRVKDAWVTRPDYGRTVRGWDIYVAVLEHGVRSPDDFAAWLRDRAADAPA